MDIMTKEEYREYIESTLRNCQEMSDASTDLKVLLSVYQLQFNAMSELYKLGNAIGILNEIPAEDAQPVIVTENMSTVAFCDRFICKRCDIHLENWVKVVIDPDDGDELHYEYEFKFCPECGAKVKDGDTE